MTKTANSNHNGNKSKNTIKDDHDKRGKINNNKGLDAAKEKQSSDLRAPAISADKWKYRYNVATENSKFQTGDHGNPAGKSNGKDSIDTKERDVLKSVKFALPSNKTETIPTSSVTAENISSFTNNRRNSFEKCSIRNSIQQQETQPSSNRPSSGGSNSAKKERRKRSIDGSQNQPQPGAFAMPGRGVGQLPTALRTRLAARGSIRDRVSTLWDSTRQSFSGFQRQNINSSQHQHPNVTSFGEMKEEKEEKEGVVQEQNRMAAIDYVTVSIVDDGVLKSNLQKEIIAESIDAQNVILVDEDEENAKKVRCICYWALTLLIVLGTVIGLSIGLTRKNESAMAISEFPSAGPTLVPTHTMIPTLETIQNNGKVRCGIGYFPNIETDLCRALAAAVLGDPEKIDLVNHTLTTRWEALANESLDVLTMSSTYTMSRDVYQKEAKVGFTFSAPFLYDGLVFAGIPEYVDCADRLDTYFGNCGKVRICVNMGGAFHDLLSDYLIDISVRPVKVGTLHEMFMKGQCNVLAGNSVVIAESALRKKGYTGDYKMGKTLLLREPISMVTREDDKKWSDFVNWVFRSLLAAEEQNITNTTASKFMTTTVFGDKYSDMFVNAIQAVGNYGDIYRRHMEDSIPRDNLMSNLLNNGSTGLHFAYPLGTPNLSPDPIAGSTIHSITKEEGKLRCGIFDRVGFGKEIVSTKGTRWEGMDADYCYALSASLFEGDTDKVVFVNLTNSVDGFQALDSGLVDVVAGVPLTLEADVNEVSTGKGYTFSMPYFYGGANGEFVEENVSETPEGALSLVTREDDSQWSDFIFWVVSATYRAEKEFITQQTSQEMLGVTVFGPSFVDMHRHAIGAVGNYGEIYSRNIESIAPRQGRNLLNTNPFGPQHWSFF